MLKKKIDVEPQRLVLKNEGSMMQSCRNINAL